MGNILICNNQLLKIAGSEVHVFELAKYFSSLGFFVTIGSFAFSPYFVELLQSHNIKILNLKRDDCLQEWDVIWTHHVTCFHEIHVRRKLRARKIIHGILSVVVPIELPPFSKNFLPSVSNFSIYANSSMTKDFVIEKVSSDVDVQILKNLVSAEWTTFHRRQSSQLRRLGVVSNHAPKEIIGLKRYFQDRGVEFEVIGGRGSRVLVTPEVLSRFDAIISIGKTVQYCLVLGIPIFVYDHYGGPGWLDCKNIDQAEYYNFNGRCVGLKYQAADLCELIFDGYSDAVAFAEVFVPSAIDRYGIAQQLNRLSFGDFSREPVCMISGDLQEHDVINTLSSVNFASFEKKWARRWVRWRKRLGF